MLPRFCSLPGAHYGAALKDAEAAEAAQPWLPAGGARFQGNMDQAAD